MSEKSTKHGAALHLAHSGAIKFQPRQKPGLMKPDNLYLIMLSQGWRWNGQVWDKDRFTDAQTPAPEITASVEPSTKSGAGVGVFTIRIMAHQSMMPKITAEFAEFAELFDWQVLSISDSYANHGEGEFCRVYIRMSIPNSA